MKCFLDTAFIAQVTGEFLKIFRGAFLKLGDIPFAYGNTVSDESVDDLFGSVNAYISYINERNDRGLQVVAVLDRLFKFGRNGGVYDPSAGIALVYIVMMSFFNNLYFVIYHILCSFFDKCQGFAATYRTCFECMVFAVRDLGIGDRLEWMFFMSGLTAALFACLYPRIGDDFLFADGSLACREWTVGTVYICFGLNQSWKHQWMKRCLKTR